MHTYERPAPNAGARHRRESMVYDRPETLTDALAILAREPRTVLAGGTDLYPATAAADARRAASSTSPASPSSPASPAATAHLRIGACTTWADDPRRRAAARLRRAARRRGRGRRPADPERRHHRRQPLQRLARRRRRAAAPRARRRGRARRRRRPPPPAARRLPARRPRAPRCRPDEILTAVLVPEAALAGRSAFLKLGARALSRHLHRHGRGPARRRRTAASPPPRSRSAPAARSRTRLPAVEAAPRRRRRRRAPRRPRRRRRGRRRARARSTTCAPPPPTAPRPPPSCSAAPSRCGRWREPAPPRLGFTLNGRPVAFDAPPTAPPLRASCARTPASPAPRSAATPATAAPAPCCSTARRSAPASPPPPASPGRRVTTVEGLADGRRSPACRPPSSRHGAAQCGICTPGMLMAADRASRPHAAPRPRPRSRRPRRRPLPLHRLPQDHRRGRGRRRRDAAAPPPPPAPPSAPRLPRLDGAAKVDGSDGFGADLWRRGGAGAQGRPLAAPPRRLRLRRPRRLVRARPGVAARLHRRRHPRPQPPSASSRPSPTSPPSPSSPARFRGEAVALVAFEDGAAADLDGFPVTWTPLPALADPAAAERPARRRSTPTAPATS